MLIYELPASSLKCRAQPNVIRRSFEPYDQMLYHRTILEPHTAYPIPAGTNYIVLMVQKTAFGLDIIPESLLPQLIQKGFHVGDFRKMKKFDQTPYKLPPPTPIHVPDEKRSLEEKSLPLSKKRSKMRITPVMRHVSRRPELPMAPVQIPHVLEPVQIPLVPQSPVQIPVSQVPQPPVQIPHVPEPLVQIPVSQVPQPPLQIPPVQIPDVPHPVHIPVSQVPQPTVQIPDVQDPVQIPHVPEPPVKILHVPEPMQIPPSSTLWNSTLWSRQMHSTSSCHSYLDPQPKNSSCFTRSRLKVISRGSFPVSPSLGGVAALKYGSLPFGSHALHATGRRVRDLVDVVGRLGNVSRREPTLACSVSPILETGFGNTCGTLASERLGPWDAL
ncbi:uncharacterized protein TNCV_2474881 [Trichonephila clavipes]|nr:uncharacterized protein TNCV_2474881 [Trichonephila clavipes]